MCRSLWSVILIGIWFSLSGQLCTKEIVFGRDYYTTPQKAYFQADRSSILAGAKKALEHFGYEIQNLDEARGRIATGWRPVEVDSHYFNLFERKDYGASDGSYYQLMVDLAEEGARTKVMVSTKVKTIVGRLDSSGKIEKKILVRLEDYLRSPQIELSNVGVKRK